MMMRKSEITKRISTLSVALFVLAGCPLEAVYAQTAPAFISTKNIPQETVLAQNLAPAMQDAKFEGVMNGRMVSPSYIERRCDYVDTYQFTKTHDADQYQIFERLPQGGLGRVLWVHEWVDGIWVDQEYFYDKNPETGMEVMTILDYASGTYISMELAQMPKSLPFDLNHLENWLNSQSHFKALTIQLKSPIQRDSVLEPLFHSQNVILESFDLKRIYDVLHLGRGPPTSGATTKEISAPAHEEVVS